MRKCYVCAGTGNLWGTPPLLEQGGLKDNKKTPRISDDSIRDYGLNVMCWRCLGKGFVPDDRRDEGETNDVA